MEWISPAIAQALVQYGILPVLLGLAAFSAWRNLTRQLEKMEKALEKMSDVVNQIDRRIFAIEIQSQIEQ